MGDREVTGLDRLGQAIAQAQDEVLARGEHGCLTEVRSRLLASRPPRRPLRRLAYLAAGAALATAVVLAVMVLLPRRELTFVVGDGSDRGVVGSWLSPSGPQPLKVRFSDGTLLQLEPGSAGRVKQLHARGAQVLLERGSAELLVVPRAGARWEAEAGPFRVRVLGTHFKLAWEPEGQRFDLNLKRGRVELTGPVLGKRVLADRETVRVWVAARRLELQAAGAKEAPTPERDPPTPAEPAPTPPPPPSPEARQVPSKPAPRRVGPGPVELAKSGRYHEALAAAERIGWPTVLQQLSADGLLVLGDAARLAGVPRRAKAIYTAVRQRFPGSTAAALAAFSIGRMDFDRRQDFGAAARWFETYLVERPDGQLAREALGRLMEARHRGGEAGAARKAARRYLARYPQGPHAKLARSLVEGVRR